MLIALTFAQIREGPSLAICRGVMATNAQPTGVVPYLAALPDGDAANNNDLQAPAYLTAGEDEGLATIVTYQELPCSTCDIWVLALYYRPSLNLN